MTAGTIGWVTDFGAPIGGGRLRPASGEALRQPKVLASRNGLLDVQLIAGAGVRLAGWDTSAWGFNGTSPGPTLRVRPGDLIRLRLTNRIGQPTNLHTHGLHVSPQGNSDNPFITVDPGGSFNYAITVPSDHPAGTFWYHPHHHGTVADQIFAGLAGALLIDSGADPEIPVSDDLVLLVTDTTLDAAGRVVASDPMTRMMGRQGDLVLVNGQHQPVIAAAPAAMQRWRVINGCVSRVLALRLDGHGLTQVAIDGAFLPAPVERDQVVLAPGNRVDLLVRPVGGGRYALVADPYDPGGMGMLGMMGGSDTNIGPVLVATLAVTGPAAAPANLPTTLPAPPAPPDTVARRRRITFAMGMGGMGGGVMGMGAMAFTIDGRTFDPERDDQTVQLGTVEDWTVLNTGPMDHPFHLHAWPFQVRGNSRGTTPSARRQDVVLVPAGGWVRLRIPFTDYAGRSVYHCHILDHEDLGMMATVDVQG